MPTWLIDKVAHFLCSKEKPTVPDWTAINEQKFQTMHRPQGLRRLTFRTPLDCKHEVLSRACAQIDVLVIVVVEITRIDDRTVHQWQLVRGTLWCFHSLKNNIRVSIVTKFFGFLFHFTYSHCFLSGEFLSWDSWIVSQVLPTVFSFFRTEISIDFSLIDFCRLHQRYTPNTKKTSDIPPRKYVLPCPRVNQRQNINLRIK